MNSSNNWRQYLGEKIGTSWVDKAIFKTHLKQCTLLGSKNPFYSGSESLIEIQP